MAGLLSQRMWASVGWHHGKPGSASVQTSETSSGTLNPRFEQNCSAATKNGASSMISAVGGVTRNSESSRA